MTNKESRDQVRELRQRLIDWKALNPDHCPECACRPGMGDSDDGGDHERYCPSFTL